MATQPATANVTPGGPGEAPRPHYQLRATFEAIQGGRKYMEDEFCVAKHSTAADPEEILYTYFGVFDGHGGGQASAFARDQLLQHIERQEGFWSDSDAAVLNAIKNGFLSLHYAMWRESVNWPKNHELPSTAGTTASVVFLRRNKLFVGHVGDSGIVLGYQNDPNAWKAKKLTTDHVPNNPDELARIGRAGGKVAPGTNGGRIIFDRPVPGFERCRAPPTFPIPFLSMSRALGDFWSYNNHHKTFVVSPEPDTFVMELDQRTFRCIILGTDGLWNMVTPQGAVDRVYNAHMENTGQLPDSQEGGGEWINCSKMLVKAALDGWGGLGARADNITAVTVINYRDVVPNLSASEPATAPPIAIDQASTGPAAAGAPPTISATPSSTSTPLPPQVTRRRTLCWRSSSSSQGRQRAVSTPAPEAAAAASGPGMNELGSTPSEPSGTSGTPRGMKRRIDQVGLGPSSPEQSARRKSDRSIRPSVRLLESMEYFGNATSPSKLGVGPSEPKKRRPSASATADAPTKTN